MTKNELTDFLGFQKIACKNPRCRNIFKTVFFLEGWTKKTVENNGSVFVQDHGGTYYRCSQCGSKNYVVFEGDKIILEKITHIEVPAEKNSDWCSQKTCKAPISKIV